MEVLADKVPSVKASEHQLFQVFLNIVVNSMEAMDGKPDGLLKIKTSYRGGSMVTVSFEDNGCGLVDMNRLFEPFYTTRKTGLGLGLFNCRQIIEMHGGTIHAESRDEKGAVFIIRLPVEVELTKA